MKSVIVTITGQPRTGKDTLIEMIRGELMRDLFTEHVMVVSSIDSAKAFLRGVAIRELGMSPSYFDGLDPTAADRRQGLSLIKQGLDMALGYTTVLPFMILEERPYERVLFYQVREIENLERIRDIARTTNDKVVHFPVFVHAENPPTTGYADSDLPDPETFQWRARVTNGYDDLLRKDARLLADEILREYRGQPTG